EDGNAFIPGYYNFSSGTFTLNGGTFTVARPSTSTRYFQDSLQPGFGSSASGTITVNNGTLNILCGLEVGISGDGSLNVNGGTVIANGWFTFARGLTAGQGIGSGTFNLAGGTVYVLKNGGTGDQVGLRLLQLAATATANISGGTFYCSTIALGNNGTGAGTATLNVSGGTIYLGNGGVQNPNANAAQQKFINISGGTFRTVNLLPNANGQGGLSTVSTGGTNWTWSATGLPIVNLTNSPGPGVVTFAPEATRTITNNAAWAGPGGMTIAGPGTVIFGTTNGYTGGTTISGGTLQLNASQPASVISGLTVNSGGTLALSSAQTSAPLGAALKSGSTLLMNNNAQIVDATLALPSGATVDFNAANTQFFSNNVSGAGNVVSTLGANGIEIVTGNLAHTGSTILSNGIVAIGGTLNSSTSVIVTNTGTLAGNGTIGAPITVASANNPAATHLRIGISPMNVPDTLTVNNLTLGAGSELDVKLGASTTVGSGVNDLLVVQGNLTINPNSFLNVLPMQGLAAGTYVIVTYTGTLTGQFTNTVGGLTRYGFSLDYSTPGQIKLNVSGSNANLVWAGTNTTWDVLGAFNWLNGVARDTFKEGDAVTFDDSATNFSVVLSTTLYPASITFNGNTNWSVTASGSGRISGGTGITKNGNGTVLLAAGLGLANDYTGPVNINGGILKMNGALSLGATNGATTVASGATLDLNGQTPNGEPMIVQGTGFGGTNGAINNSSATAPNQSGGPRVITLTGDTTLNASGARWDLGVNSLGAAGGSFAGNGFNLTKIGANDIWMHELGDIGVGDILVNQGTLGFQYTIGMGNPAKTITVNPGASLGIFHAAAPLSKQVILTNGATINSSGDAGTSNVLTGAITLYGTNTINNNAFPLALTGVISGAGGFQKSGAGPLYLSAVNTYSASTFINGGSVVLGPGASIANSAVISVATNAVLDANLPGSLTIGNGKTLSGSGSVIGNVSAGVGSQIAPGTATAAGTLTLNNNLTLNGATNTIKLSGDPFTIGSGVNDLISVAGNLTASGVSTIQISPLGILSSAGSYTVMQYSGPAPSAANFHVTSTSSRYNVTLVDPATTAPFIQINITGNPGLLVWKGGAATNANIWNNSTTNWLNLSTSLRDAYLAGDNAIFDDTGLTNVVNLATTAAGLISLSNNTTAYTFIGNGLLTAALDMEGTGSLWVGLSNAPAFSSITANSGTLIFDVQGVAAYTNSATISDNFAGQGTILKAGTNTLVLAADNSSYTGTIVVTNGILQYTNVNGLGAASAPLYMTNNGTLDLTGIAPGGKNIKIAGNGFNGKGALISSSGNLVNSGTTSLTLTGDASIAALNRWDIVGSTFNANGHSLTVLGPGATLIEIAGDGSLADIHVVGGRLGFQGTGTSMGDSSKTCTVESNAVLTFFNAGTPTKNLVLNGNATIDAGGTATTLNGPVTLVGTNLFGLRVDLHIGGGVTGAGSLVAGDSPVGAGSGNLYLDGNNTYTGSTIINSGHAIIVGTSSSLGASSMIQVNGGGTLDVSAPASFTLGAGQTLIGSGTVTGAVVLASGATLAAGFPDNNTYTLTINGALTFQPGSTNVVRVNKGVAVANDTVAGLTSVNMGGTLVVTSVGNPLSGGDAIQVFTASSGYIGNFANIIPLAPGAGLTWDSSTINTDGKLRVLSTGPPTNPTNIVASVSGNQLTLSWPSSYTGWTLQGQTNAPGIGVTTNWQDVPGSITTNRVILPIDPADGSAFFRMILK
ncbi:MAG TPA: autotransporter-associated beta strand repeat-containing protein, partial [Tepidisphaeraceae bacterium]|nr:autotransporter-associated beta strand repeat-containing protein [Tepidisphaeraceae bacterium]